jgi:outer membrane lipoprotein-sorting protein
VISKSLHSLFVASLIVGLAPASGLGRGEELTAQEVVSRVRVQDDAIDDETADVDIRSMDANGVEQTSTLRLYWRNSRGAKGILGQTLLVTLSPKNRKGESFLLWQAERASESQAWLYLPDLRQALRITVAGQDAQRPKPNADMLLGFEQLGARLLAEGDRVLIGREQVSGIVYVILEERLAGETAGTRRFWVSPEYATIAKIEYYDAAGGVGTTQTIEWQQVGGAWVWKRVEVRTFNPPAHTVLNLRNVKVNTGLSDRLFTVNTLKSGVLP